MHKCVCGQFRYESDGAPCHDACECGYVLPDDKEHIWEEFKLCESCFIQKLQDSNEFMLEFLEFIRKITINNSHKWDYVKRHLEEFFGIMNVVYK